MRSVKILLVIVSMFLCGGECGPSAPGDVTGGGGGGGLDLFNRQTSSVEHQLGETQKTCNHLILLKSRSEFGKRLPSFQLAYAWNS